MRNGGPEDASGFISDVPDRIHVDIRKLRREGQDEEAIAAAEESLYCHVASRGPSSEETRAVAADLVLAYNHQGMKFLAENNIKGSLRLLQKAKLLTDGGQPFLGDARIPARAVTLNNLGCLMKKWGKPRVGIAFLARAIRIEAEVPGGADNPAGTHLNMSAALSTVGMHRAAAAHARHAIGLASQAIERLVVESNSTDEFCGDSGGPEHGESLVAPADGSSSCSRYGPEQGEIPVEDAREIDSVVGEDGRAEENPLLPARRADQEAMIQGKTETAPYTEAKVVQTQGDVSGGDNLLAGGRYKGRSAAGGLLAIAYFNLAVEREHLGQVDAALHAYGNARVAANVYLGPDSPMAKGIEAVLQTTFAAPTSNATNTAVPSHRRANAGPGVASFPSIGKLRLRSRPHNVNLDDGSPRASRCGSPRRPELNGAKGDPSQILLSRAYETPRPRPPQRPTTGACFDGPSPRGSAGGGPQRAGRWMSVAPSPRGVKAQRSGGFRGGRSGYHDREGDLLWRARACVEFACSPREARQAQLSGRRLDRVLLGRSSYSSPGRAEYE